MLMQFTVENFQSIKDKVILSLVPGVDKEHKDKNITCINNEKAVNALAIYGANASGKSNLFKAMTVAIITIRNSTNFQINFKLPMVPFKFDEKSLNKATSFEFLFIASDKKKYRYGFSATENNIVEEYLYVYNSKKPSMIFERDKNNNYKFPRNLKAELDVVAKRNTSNKLFLSTATSWNVEITKPAFEWFAFGIDTYTNLIDMQHMALEMYRNEKDREYTLFTQNLLKCADINISNIDIETREVSPEESRPLPFGIFFNFGVPAKQVEYKVTTAHSIKDENGDIKEYPLLLNDESLGTQQLFTFGPILKQALDSGKTIFIDEIEKSLHPFIVKRLISLFRDKNINKNGAQIVATTHETTLLSLDIFRRDQIYFTEKIKETGVTTLYSLDEFPVRKTENIEKGYLMGRYGAIPFLSSEGAF